MDSPELRTVPLDYARCEGGLNKDRRLAVLMMYALPSLASMICFWLVTGKIAGGVSLTGCLSAGPFFLPLAVHYKSTEFLATVAEPATGFVILAGWLALVMWTRLKRISLLIHLILWVAWMVIGFAGVCQIDS